MEPGYCALVECGEVPHFITSQGTWIGGKSIEAPVAMTASSRLLWQFMLVLGCVRLFFDKLKDEVQGEQLTDDTNVLKTIKAAPHRTVTLI